VYIPLQQLKRSSGRWRLGVEGGRYLSVDIYRCLSANGRRIKLQRFSLGVLAGKVFDNESLGACSSENI
jgi:hypothetical protein